MDIPYTRTTATTNNTAPLVSYSSICREEELNLTTSRSIVQGEKMRDVHEDKRSEYNRACWQYCNRTNDKNKKMWGALVDLGEVCQQDSECDDLKKMLQP